jgi:hypothetical protein
MTRRDEITRDIERTAGRYFEPLSFRERRQLKYRIARLFAERDALTPAEAIEEAP